MRLCVRVCVSAFVCVGAFVHGCVCPWVEHELTHTLTH